jgi:hypothetical protein
MARMKAAKVRKAKKTRSAPSPSPNARAYERANANARFKRTSSPSTAKKTAATKKIPAIYTSGAVRSSRAAAKARRAH